MKNITKNLYTILAAAAGVFATSCQLSEVSDFEPSNVKREVTISANYTAESKVAVDRAWSSTWEEGDVIGAYTLGDTEMSEFVIGNIADDAKSADFTGEAGDRARFVYPMSSQAIANNEYAIELAGATMTGAEASTWTGASEDIVLASSNVVDIAGGESSIVMQHQTAFLKLALTASTNGANLFKTIKINKVTIKGAAGFAGIPTSATLDLSLSSTDEGFYTVGAAGEYVLDMSASGLNVSTPFMSGMQATAVDAVIAVLPFELQAGEGLEFTYEVEVADNSGVVSKYTYTQTKENTTGEVMEFAKASYNTIALDIPFEELASDAAPAPITATILNITETTADCIIEYEGVRAFYVCSTDGTMTDYMTVMSQGPTMAYESGGTNPLIDLTAATDYYLYPIVMDNLNVYHLGEVVSFRTLGDASPITVTVSNITQTTVDCVFDYESMGMAFYLCTTDGTMTDVNDVLTAEGAAPVMAAGEVTQITGLTPNTEYFIYPILPDLTVNPAVYELGEIVSFETLPEENAPASISVEVSGVTSSHADFTFTYDNALAAYFYCSTEEWETYTWSDVAYAYGKQMIIPFYESGELYSYFAALAKSTTYYVYTAACNEKGEYVVGERVEFTTLEEDPTYSITAAISNVTHNSADCIFTYETMIGCYVVTTEAGITDADELYNNYVPVMANGSGVLTTITGLEQMTKYYVYPIAVDAEMNKTIGKVESFTTDPEPVDAVTKVGGQAVNITANSADVIINYENTQAQYYMLSTDGTLSEVYDIMGNGSKVLFSEMSGSSVPFSGLTAGTDYFVYTVAIDLTGTPVMGDTIKFTTLDE